MNQEAAGLLLFVLLISVPFALRRLSKGSANVQKTPAQATCPHCGHTLVITLDNLQS